MGKPAARLTDPHTCPMVTGVVPHVGGPISGPGCPTVLIGGLPAARVSDLLVCTGPPDVIVKGSATVTIGGLPAARLGDSTAHGGVIVGGCPTVLIGDRAGGGGGAGGGGAGAGSSAGNAARGVENALLRLSAFERGATSFLGKFIYDTELRQARAPLTHELLGMVTGLLGLPKHQFICDLDINKMGENIRLIGEVIRNSNSLNEASQWLDRISNRTSDFSDNLNNISSDLYRQSDMELSEADGLSSLGADDAAAQAFDSAVADASAADSAGNAASFFSSISDFLRTSGDTFGSVADAIEPITDAIEPLGKALGYVGIGFTLYQYVGQPILATYQQDESSPSGRKRLGSDLARAAVDGSVNAGIVFGAQAAGMALGSLILPPIGTMVGGAIGAYVGSYVVSHYGPQIDSAVNEGMNAISSAVGDATREQDRLLGDAIESVSGVAKDVSRIIRW